MLDAIVVTLALKPKYIAMAATMLRSFTLAGNATLVVTDDSSAFDPETTAIPYVSDGTNVFHAKRQAVRAGLERAHTVYFVDADFVPYQGLQAEVPKLKQLPAGIGGFALDMQLSDLNFCSLGKLENSPTHLAVLQDASAHFHCNWRELIWCGDFLYYISRDEAGAWQKFMRAWDEFAHIYRNGFTSDGLALAFATYACGWRPLSYPLALKPISRAFWHARVGEHNRRQPA